jgi:CheY-like chemotaxis protein
VEVPDPASIASEQLPGRHVALLPFRILIAEDLLTNRWLLDRQLRRLGCFVAAEGDGRAAIAALEAADYDMLITDCHMPEIDSAALAGMVRAAETARGVCRSSVSPPMSPCRCTSAALPPA